MPTPHKHAELIKKWADDSSLEIEFRNPLDLQEGWKGSTSPSWFPNLEYRIKPKLVKREGWIGIRKADYPYSKDDLRRTTNVVPTKQLLSASCDTNVYTIIKVEWEEEV